MVWIKLALAKSLRVQIWKGRPGPLLAHEARVIRAMAERGAPVPQILVQGADYLVLADCGQVLTERMADCAGDALQAAGLMSAVGRALARLHRLGCTHGRPYIRDVLVTTDDVVTFIDMERGARLDAPERFQFRDLGLLVLSVYARWTCCVQAERFLSPLLGAYFSDMPKDQAIRVAAWTRRWRWAVALTAPARWRERHCKPQKMWKEYQALPLMLDRLARPGPA